MTNARKKVSTGALPRLTALEIRSPCSESWAAMLGSDQLRLCQHCNKHVHNLSAMVPAEAEALLASKPADLCVRVETSANGSVLSRGIAPGEPGRVLALPRWAVRMASALLLGWLLPSCREAAEPPLPVTGQDPPEDMRVLMGEICLPEEPFAATGPEETSAGS